MGLKLNLHPYAYYNTLELLQIKSLLGHASVQSTTIYLHLANMPLWTIIQQTVSHTCDPDELRFRLQPLV